VELLYFQLGGAPYAIALDSIADVAPAGPIHPVPLSPPAVLGLAERRGRAIAVIDLPALLNDSQDDPQGVAHLMRLAGPLAGAALFVPAAVFSGSGSPATDGHVWIDGRLHVLLDAEALVKRAAAFN
jgi:chemotaxis signal transduction protein